jgi:hypothetical protein
MIEVLDEVIKDLLVEKVPLNLSEVDISFDVPNREWSAKISKPTINIYLHDIRENHTYKTGGEWVTERLNNGEILKVKLGNQYDLSYLITAWTTNTEDEHRLLWYVLSTLVRYPQLPKDILPDLLQRQPYPLNTKVAQPDGVLRNAADVWTALDNQLKPVITYVVTLALDAHIMNYSKQVRSRFLRFFPPVAGTAEEAVLTGRNGNGSLPDGVSEYVQIGGRVFEKDKPDRPVGAEVILLEQGLNSRTDSQGRFKFNRVVHRNQCTLLVVASGYITTRKTVTIPSPSYDIELEPENISVDQK